MAGRRLEESELTTMTEHGTQIGGRGLSYGTPAAEEMIAERMRKLAESGYCTEGEARSVAVGQLAQEGNLKTEETVSGEKRYLVEVRQAGPSAEEETGALLATLSELEQLDRRHCQEMRLGGVEPPTEPLGWMVQEWLLTRLAGWVSENPRHQGFAAKTLPELDALAEPTGADA
jgi:hypothetical protein